MSPERCSDAEVLAYLAGEHDGPERPPGAADLDDLRELLADHALWESPGPGLADRIVAAVAVEASTAAPAVGLAGPKPATEPAGAPPAPPGPPTQLRPRRRGLPRPAVAAAVAASVVLGMVVGVQLSGDEGSGPPAADMQLSAQAQAIALPVPGAPSVPLSNREKEQLPQEDLRELFGGAGAEKGPDLGRFPGLLYWLTSGPDGSSRLSREIATFYDRAGRATGALRAMLNRHPVDPDERNPWPQGSGADVDVDAMSAAAAWPDGTAVVYLNAAALRGTASADVARMAIQQIVWTLTANDPTIRQAVITTLDPKARKDLRERGLWGTGVPVGKPTRPGDPLKVLAPVQVDGPREGAVLDPGVFAVSGAAAATDGRVRWQVLSRGQVVQEGTATTEPGGGLKAFVFRLSLRPGFYTVTVRPAGTETGGVSRTFRVRGVPA